MVKNRWLMFIVLYIGSLAIGLNQFKVPPIMGDLAQIFQVDITSVAWLMSIFTVAGVALAIPSAMIIGKLGPKKLGAIVLFLLTVGSFMGAVAPNFSTLLFSRAIEGIGFALIILIGMVLISTWFKPEEMGIPTGIFVTFPAVAPFIMFNYAAEIVAAHSWNYLWFMGGIIGAVSLVLFLAVIQVPKAEAGPGAVGESPSLAEGLANLKVFLLGIVQGSISFVLFGFLTVYPLIFANYYHMDVLTANSYSGLAGLFGIFTCIFSGIVIAKTGKPEWINLVSTIGLVITCAMTFKLTPDFYVVHTFFLSLFTGLVIPSVLTIAPAVAKKPTLIGYAFALVNLIYFIGTFVGAPVVTSFVDPAQGNWSDMSIPLTIVAAAGVAASALFMAMSKKTAASRDQTITN